MTAKPGIIYLQKDKFQLFSPFLRQIVEFRFVPEIVRDSDVINKELLESLIKVFVTNTKIPPGNLTIVLADNAYFIKDFVLPPQPKTTQAGQQPQMSMETLHVMSMDFVEHVPYENVVSKSIPLKEGIRVCAVNKDFFDAISDSFTKLGFSVDAVYPGFLLGNNLGAKPVLDSVLVNAIFQKVGTLKQYDLLSQEVYKPELRKEEGDTNVETEAEEVETDAKNKKPDKKRLFLMVGVLGILLIILAIVYVQSLAPVPPPVPVQPAAQSAAPPVDNSTGAVSSAPAENPTAAPAILKTQNLSAQIISSPDSGAVATILQQEFGKYTFKNLTVQKQATTTSSTTVVSFSGNVTQEIRNAILIDLQKVKSDVTVQDKQEGDFDITVLLGK